MAIAADFSVDRTTKNIRHVSGTATYDVLSFHRYLQDLADDAAASGDDMLDITDVNPSDRSTDNIITLLNGYNIDDTAAQYLYNGSISQNAGNDVYVGLVVVGSVVSGTQLQIIQNNAVTTSFWGTVGSTALNPDSSNLIISRFLVKVRSGGADIDNQRFRVVARELGNTYGEFEINQPSLGNNTAALVTSVDLNNQTAAGTISGWSITNTEGYQLLDVDNDTVGEPYYSQWDPGTRSIKDLYEYTKWLTRRGSSSTIYGMNGFLFRGLTHSVTFTGKVGTYTQNENVTWGTGGTAGAGKLLAITSSGATGTMWVQRTLGAIPSSAVTITGGSSGATATIGTVAAQTIGNQFLGTYTGTALLGTYGAGVKVSKLSANDRLVDLTGATHAPPNTVTFTVAGLTSGDRVFVAPWDGSTVDLTGAPKPNTTQLTLSGSLTGAAVTSIVVATAIPADTPTTGTIRVVNNAGYHVRVAYTSWTGSTFTVTSTNFSGSGATANASSGNGVYITYIDKATATTSEAFSVIYSGSDRNLMVRVRDGAGVAPIKTFTTPAILSSGGGAATAIRTSDA